MEHNSSETQAEKTKVLRVNTDDFYKFELLMIDHMIDNEKVISKKEFFGELIKNAIKKGADQAPKNTL